MSEQATAFAPASIGNVSVGFDMLGLAIDGVGDRVGVRRTGGDGVAIAAVFDRNGEPHTGLATEPAANTASIAAQAFWNAHGDGGIELTIHKGVPLQSGMGSSAASAVAAVMAANALLEKPLHKMALLPFALEGEHFASKGLHADNVAPSLFGGLVLCPPSLLPDVFPLNVPAGVSAVVLHPDLRVNTAESRNALGGTVTRELWIEQQGLLAAFIVACANNDIDTIRRTLRDVIVEPQRASNVACFGSVTRAAKVSGALGCGLSGSGPSLFAFALDDDADDVAAAMMSACKGDGIDCESWISSLAAPGARVED